MNITYKLNALGDFALLILNGVNTQEWHSTKTNQAYLAWLEEGNTPQAADE